MSAVENKSHQKVYYPSQVIHARQVGVLVLRCASAKPYSSFSKLFQIVTVLVLLMVIPVAAAGESAEQVWYMYSREQLEMRKALLYECVCMFVNTDFKRFNNGGHHKCVQ